MRQALATATVMLAAMTVSCLLDEEDGDGSNYVGINEIAEAYQEAQCTHLTECGLFPSREACMQAQLSTLPSMFVIDPNVEAAIYAGHVIYNGSAVKACIDAIAVRSCDRTDASVRVVPPECRTFFRGTLASGEGCYVDEECLSQRCSGDSGSTCSLGSCIGDTPPTTTPGNVGDICSTVNGCVDSAYCDTQTGMCEPHKTSGMACTLDNECTYGLGCTGTTGNRTCAALPTLGQPCSIDGICRDEGAYCDFNANMCTAYLLPSAPCGSSGQTCSPYYPCNFSATTPVCTQGPGLGQPCSSSSRCFDAGTFCDFNLSSPVCVALKADGAPCSSSEECQSASCDFNLNVCAAPVTCL